MLHILLAFLVFLSSNSLVKSSFFFFFFWVYFAFFSTFQIQCTVNMCFCTYIEFSFFFCSYFSHQIILFFYFLFCFCPMIIPCIISFYFSLYQVQINVSCFRSFVTLSRMHKSKKSFFGNCYRQSCGSLPVSDLCKCWKDLTSVPFQL